MNTGMNMDTSQEIICNTFFKIDTQLNLCMKQSWVKSYPRAPTFTMSWPMSWFHEDPEHTLEQQLSQDENNCLLNVYDLSPSQCYDLEKTYNIYTIGELVEYIIKNGFPRDVDFRERTKFVLSARVAKKFLGSF